MGTIPELLLIVDTHAGTAILGNVAYISRLLTSGGVAPAGACIDGATVAVPYGGGFSSVSRDEATSPGRGRLLDGIDGIRWAGDRLRPASK